ncbi:MAG: acyl carrier protein [Lachnospiraceae bacterium]|nr:acyl carrier protein [Lachnospiraceae bacterium]
MDEIKSVLREVLLELHPDVDPDTETALADKKIIDSFDIVTIIARIDEEFDVAVTADKIIPANFNSIDALAALVSSLMDED